MLSKVFREIKQFSRRNGISLFFAGGFLRDILLDRSTQDIDVVVSGETRKVAWKFARHIKGSFVCLDEENEIYRIAGKYNFDFSRLKGKSIEEDLSKRDFTINAMAVRADQVRRRTDIRENIIDPHKGLKDLKNRKIRTVADSAFRNDPLRMLRAWRLSATLNFQISRGTALLIRKQAGLLKHVAPERVRDELLMVLGTVNSSFYIAGMERIGLLHTWIPEMKLMYACPENYFHKDGLWGHSIQSLSALEDIFKHLENLFPRWKRKIEGYLSESMGPLSERSTILKFATLFHDLGKPSTVVRTKEEVHFFGHEKRGSEIVKGIMQRLRMSNQEIAMVKRLIWHHMRPGNLASGGHPSRKALFRFFRDLEGEGIGALLLSLADRHSYRNVGPHPKEIRTHEKVIKQVINRYYQEPSRVRPRPILNGHQIMDRFRLSSGPLIGKLLSSLLEAQAEGKVKTEEDGYRLLEGYLAEGIDSLRTNS